MAARTASVPALAIALVVACTTSVMADEVDPAARATELANTGITALQEGRWDAAIEALRAALPIALEAEDVPLVGAIQRGLGKAYDFRGEPDAALVYYRAYLTHDLPEPLKRKEVEERIAAIEAVSRSRLVIDANAPGARVIVDGAPAVSVDTELVLAPGRHWIQVHAAGYNSLEDDVFLIGGETLRYEARLQVATSAPVRPVVVAEPVDEGGGNGWVWVAWLAGIGMGAAGVAMISDDGGPILVAGGASVFLISSIVLIAD